MNMLELDHLTSHSIPPKLSSGRLSRTFFHRCLQPADAFCYRSTGLRTSLTNLSRLGSWESVRMTEQQGRIWNILWNSSAPFNLIVITEITIWKHIFLFILLDI